MTSTQQRAELQNQIWKIANDVRGSIDGWDFKQYILGTLFYRFISDNFDSKEDIEHFAKSVDSEDIAQNDYNLSVSSYVEAKDTREKIDIKVLNSEIATTVTKIENLRNEIDKIVKSIENE